MVKLSLRFRPVGTFETEIDEPRTSHEEGMPRPTISVPSERWATSESNRTVLACAIPHVWGTNLARPPDDSPATGCSQMARVELSHHEFGPLWLCRSMNW